MKKGSMLVLIGSCLIVSMLAGCGGSSNGGGQKTPPAAPGAPLLTPGNGQLAATWDAVSGAASYQVWYGTTNDSSTANRFGSDINVCSCTITGLTNRTLYYVWIKAKNSAGTSGFSPAASGTPTTPSTPLDPPGRPTVTSGDGQLTVSWTAVTGAEKYWVYYHTADDSSPATHYSGDPDETDTTCNITGLENGTTYYVWVKAVYNVGWSDFSPSESGVPFGAPGTPVLTAGNGILNVNWSAVRGAYFYEVYYSLNNNSASATKFAGDPNDADCFCTIYGLDNGTGYYVWLKAKRSENSISAFGPVAYETPKYEPAATIYSAGTYTTTNQFVPCYWQVATHYDLPLPSDWGPDYIAGANSIFLASGLPYIAGFYKSYGCNYACYWVNTGNGIERYEVDGGQTVNESVVSSAANSIYVSGANTVYIAGNCSSAGLGAYYWTGGTKYNLEGGANSHTNSIYVSGSTVYNAGYCYQSSMDSPCYWTGTVKTDLGNGIYGGGYAIAIFVESGVVYTAGYYYDSGKYIPCYWVGTTRHDLPGSATFNSNNYLAPANSIFVAGGKVYVGGYYSKSDGYSYMNTPCFWVDGVRHELEGDLSYHAYVTSIFVLNGTVYTGGYCSTNLMGTNNYPCFWVGATRHSSMECTSNDGRVNSIFVQ